MTREERLELLKQIEKDIHVCSLVSTLLEDAKSCAIHSVIEELEQESGGDCVSREALDRELYERFLEEGNTITMIPLGAVRNFIKELPTVTPATAWHKVEEEGCPKAAGKYLVVRITEYGYKTTIAMWLGWDESWIEEKVVAWMPLPEWGE